MKVGKIYMSDQQHLCLYPDRESAVEVEEVGCGDPYRCGATSLACTEISAFFWSRKLGKPVHCIKICVSFLVLHKDRSIVEVLVGERKGFILYRKWMILKEVI